MFNKHPTAFNDLLAARNMKGNELARLLGVEPSSVSKWRNGLTPGPRMRKLMIERLTLSAEEIAALGWDEEPAHA